MRISFPYLWVVSSVSSLSLSEMFSCHFGEEHLLIRSTTGAESVSTFSREKHPMHWVWENPTGSCSEPTDWGTEVEPGSFYPDRGGCASGDSSGGASFDPRYACMSRSSKSASNSSLTEEMKIPKFSAEAFKGYPKNFNSKRDVTAAASSGASPTLESSICSSEPSLSLNLGKQSCVEYMSDGSNSKTSNFHLIAEPPDASAKRIKLNSQRMPAPRCQVEGCSMDLCSAKDYHRKHRVCERHSKSPKVIVNGVERRFCQQCSRFHGLSEFDENKRSCRKRLTDHNARRRRPPPDVAHFNQARLSTIIYGGLPRMNTIYSGVPFENAKSSINSTWPNTSSLNFMQTKECAWKPGKPGCADGDPHVCTGHRLPTTMTAIASVSDGSYELPPAKAATVKILGGGSEESLISSSSLDAPQDLCRALSLLSTDSRDSRKQRKPVLHSMNNSSIHKPWTCGLPQTLSIPSLTEYWNMEQGPSNSQRHNLTPQNSISGNGFGSSNFPDCLLPSSEGQHEFGFESVHLD